MDAIRIVSGAMSTRACTLCMSFSSSLDLLFVHRSSSLSNPSAVAVACTSASSPRESTPESTLAVITRATTDADATKQPGLVDSTSALSALHLLSKYLRTKQHRLQHELTPEDDIDVGPGLQLGPSDHHHHARDSHEEAYLQQHTNLYSSIWLNISASWSEDLLHPERYHQMSSSEKARLEKCMDWFRTYDVKVDAGFGRLPKEFHQEFDQLKCPDLISLEVTAQYIHDHPDLYNRVCPVPTDRPRVKAEPGMEEKVIATIVAITTRSLTITRLEDLALFQYLLPSFERTVEPGFEYWYVKKRRPSSATRGRCALTCSLLTRVFLIVLSCALGSISVTMQAILGWTMRIISLKCSRGSMRT
jgi:hypothetical protein